MFGGVQSSANCCSGGWGCWYVYIILSQESSGRKNRYFCSQWWFLFENRLSTPRIFVSNSPLKSHPDRCWAIALHWRPCWRRQRPPWQCLGPQKLAVMTGEVTMGMVERMEWQEWSWILVVACGSIWSKVGEAACGFLLIQMKFFSTLVFLLSQVWVDVSCINWNICILSQMEEGSRLQGTNSRDVPVVPCPLPTISRLLCTATRAGHEINLNPTHLIGNWIPGSSQWYPQHVPKVLFT